MVSDKDLMRLVSIVKKFQKKYDTEVSIGGSLGLILYGIHLPRHNLKDIDVAVKKIKKPLRRDIQSAKIDAPEDRHSFMDMFHGFVMRGDMAVEIREDRKLIKRAFKHHHFDVLLQPIDWIILEKMRYWTITGSQKHRRDIQIILAQMDDWPGGEWTKVDNYFKNNPIKTEEVDDDLLF